jgi:hypothetical protein
MDYDCDELKMRSDSHVEMNEQIEFESETKAE